MVFHAVGAEAPLEEIDDAAMRQLARLHLQQVVGQREQAKAGVRSLRSAAGTSVCGGMVENFSVSSFLSASVILMP